MSKNDPLFSVGNEVLLNYFKEDASRNYIAHQIEDLDTGEEYMITMQRINGETPLHQLAKAKKEIQLLKTSIADLSNNQS
jgi:hypothetical protein